jgi:hypothetical protein
VLLGIKSGLCVGALHQLHDCYFEQRDEEAYSATSLSLFCANEKFIRQVEDALEDGDYGNRGLGKFGKVKFIKLRPEQLETFRDEEIDLDSVP